MHVLVPYCTSLLGFRLMSSRFVNKQGSGSQWLTGKKQGKEKGTDKEEVAIQARPRVARARTMAKARVAMLKTISTEAGTIVVTMMIVVAVSAPDAGERANHELTMHGLPTRRCERRCLRSPLRCLRT